MRAAGVIRCLALAVAGLFIGLGVVGVVTPGSIVAMGYDLLSRNGLYAAAGVRVGGGLVLILAAPVSRAPGILRGVGAAMVLSGVATLFFGEEAARARLDWEAAHQTFLRFEAAAFVGAGAMIVSTLRRSRRQAAA